VEQERIYDVPNNFFGFYKYEINIKSSWLKMRSRKYGHDIPYSISVLFSYLSVNTEIDKKNIEIRVWPCGGVVAP